MVYVYLLKSRLDGQYYIGQTENFKKRLAEHNEGKVRSTKSRRLMSLIGYRALPTREAARYLEYELKHHSDKKSKFIQSFVKADRS